MIEDMTTEQRAKLSILEIVSPYVRLENLQEGHISLLLGTDDKGGGHYVFETLGYDCIDKAFAFYLKRLKNDTN